jgi:transposase
MALSEEKIEQIKIDFDAASLSLSNVAKKHGVSRGTIYRLAERHNWENKPRKANPKPKPKLKKGRPEKYNVKLLPQATTLCMLGCTNKQLADFFGVHIDTIYDWKKEHPEFSDALLNGREKAACKVVVNLFQRACGYSHKEDKIFCHDGEIIRAETVKRYPPDVKAITMWLKNKFPDMWSDKKEMDVVAKVGEIQEEDVKTVLDLFDRLIQ